MANQATKDAGLLFNVNLTRSNIVRHLKTHDMLCETVDKESKETQHKLPMLSGSPVATTSVIERTCRMLLTNALKYTNKDNSGLRTVTRPALKQAVLLNEDWNRYFASKWTGFNKNHMYADQVPVSPKEFSSVVDSINNKLKLTNRATNMLNWMLAEIYVDIIHTAFEFITFAGKRTMNADSIASAVRNRFPDNISHELVTEINRATDAAGEGEAANVNAEDRDHDQSGAESSDSDNEDEAAGAESSSSKKAPRTKNANANATAKVKAKGKKGKVEQIEDEASDANAEASGSSEDEEEEEDEEEQATKAKPKAKGKSTASAKPAAKGRTTRRAAK